MRKVLLGMVVVITIALPVGVVSSATADPPTGGPPGQGECEHGNSGQTCVPDPQPTHGQDCDEHGPNEGGVNEDHCLSVSPTTSTTTPTTTTTTAPTTTSVAPTTTTTTTLPGNNTNTPTIGDSTSIAKHSKHAKASVGPALAFTGIGEGFTIGGMAAILALLLGGLYLLRRASLVDRRVK